jgi:hypothetical protein
MLKWKKKLWWAEEGTLYVHPIPAIVSLGLVVWAAIEFLVETIG